MLVYQRVICVRHILMHRTGTCMVGHSWQTPPVWCMIQLLNSESARRISPVPWKWQGDPLKICQKVPVAVTCR